MTDVGRVWTRTHCWLLDGQPELIG